MNTWYWSSWVVSEIVVDRCGSLWVVPAFSNCGHL